MIHTSINPIDAVLSTLYNDAKNDRIRIEKKQLKFKFRSIHPSDFDDAYLAISKEQGADLVQMIIGNNLKNIVEFGTSFGISTLFLAKGIAQTNGHIITTELIASKAKTALQNFEEAGVADQIELRIGDAMETLKDHKKPIDLLLLDGWKDLYLPLFQLLESNFHQKTIIYVDNADMAESQFFLKTVSQNSKYQFSSQYNGKLVIITIK
ncbi:O-methyltransferase [Flavobacterium sp. 7A]|uniref:O-methyltransferase n=1 Tax=Flavobacterium sp. 7A TaxID=2940571 RepID=UPI0022269CE9|nr:class I SAM-dependent methyltransferase [Flavobacterium sp. 7A]MCW2118074.1 putative O-methyltransferase YrrM [Flavobacterium sp. 7A]